MRLKFLPTFLLGTSLFLTGGLNAQWTQLGTGNDTIAAGTSFDINTVCTDPAGTVYAAGQFVEAAGRYVAKWNGTTWSTMGTGSNALSANGDIYTICSDPSGNIYSGGHFTNSGAMGYVAKWNGTTWSELGSGLGGATYTQDINSIVSDASGNIYAAGQIGFLSGGNLVYEVVKWNGSAWSIVGGTANGLHGNSSIKTIAVDGSGNVYATGDFTDGANAFAGHPYIAKFNGTSWSALGTGSGSLNIPISSDALAITADASGNVYAAGKFTDAQGNEYVAKWNGTAWSELGGTTSMGSTVQHGEITSLVLDASGNLYAGGGFLDATSAHNTVMKWNGTRWSNAGHYDLLAQDNAGIKNMASHGNTIYATGGNLNTRGSHFVGKYDGTTGISELSGTACRMNPNPASSSFALHFSKPITASITVTDIEGQEMIRTQINDQTEKTFAINSLAIGMYLVMIETAAGETRILKLIKE
jgi:hypothetical protein